MTQQGTGSEASTETSSEASEQAFYLRVDQLYRVYEDWTGDVVDESASPPKKQSNGDALIEPIVALSTFMAFSARLALDNGMPKEDFLSAVGEMFDNETVDESDAPADEVESDPRRKLS